MLKSLVEDWEVRLTKAQVGHYLAAEKYQKTNFYIGILLIILSSFVASSLFLETQVDLIKRFIQGASVLSMILAGIQTLIRPSEQAEIHRSKAVSYGSLRRKIELNLSLCRPGEMDEAIIREIKNEWDGIANSSPVTPNILRKKATSILNSEFEENKNINGSKKN